MEEVKIGNQIWMLKNLDIEVFRNGEEIPQATNEQEWADADNNAQPAWCYYEFSPDNGYKYGKLYNWFAVDDNRGLAPKGWRVPSGHDWAQLILNLGDVFQVGIKLKSDTGWEKEGFEKFWKTAGTNSSGFTALPGGSQIDPGYFDFIGYAGSWWSSTVDGEFFACAYELWADESELKVASFTKGCGFSVRCIK